MQAGEAEGAYPHPLWDGARYLSINPAIYLLKKSGTLRSGFRHFVECGAAEIEAGHYRHFQFKWGARLLDYDRVAYLTDNPDVRNAIAQGRFRHGLEHLFAIGFREALDGLRAIGTNHEVRLLRDVPGLASSGGKHLCLFAHYDRDEVIAPYVIVYLTALRKADVDLIFITATTAEAQLAKIRPLVRRILVKNDAGRDFGSWSLALRTLGVDVGCNYQRVIFANDSIYFPVRPIQPLFADMEQKNFNLYGMSDSRDVNRYHIQSFFLAFDHEAQRKIFPEFLDRFHRNYVLTKWGQIREYEVGITALAQAAGLSVGAYVSIDDLREEVIRDPALKQWDSTVRDGLEWVNPIHDLWNLILGEYGFCGVKVELLRDNPKKVSGFAALPRLIADGDVPLKHIYRHQDRLKDPRPRPPAPLLRQDERVVELRQRISGEGAKEAARLVLFAHYDPEGIVDPSSTRWRPSPLLGLWVKGNPDYAATSANFRSR